MLKYLIILLDDTSVSYCHYENNRTEHRLIALDVLHQAIFWAMKENLMVQFVFPECSLPKGYTNEIERIDHTKIKPASGFVDDADIVSGTLSELEHLDNMKQTAILRIRKRDFFENYGSIIALMNHLKRLNVVITDIDSFTEADFAEYRDVLEKMSEYISARYVEGYEPQINILTDRMLLKEMNNCNAGTQSITLAPDGRFYVCPAFYLEPDGYSVGDLQVGVDIRNSQLYRIDHAPICSKCDAYQCRRCIWLNRKTTMEINTPGHEQCVVAHIERNASRGLLAAIRREKVFLPGSEIKKIDYLDPFDLLK